jgi:hypothetical protein
VRQRKESEKGGHTWEDREGGRENDAKEEERDKERTKRERGAEREKKEGEGKEREKVEKREREGERERGREEREKITSEGKRDKRECLDKKRQKEFIIITRRGRRSGDARGAGQRPAQCLQRTLRPCSVKYAESRKMKSERRGRWAQVALVVQRFKSLSQQVEALLSLSL